MAENKIISQIAPVYLQSLLTYEQDFLIFDSKEADYDIQTTYAFHHYIVVTLLEQGEIDVTLNGIAHHILQAPGILYHLPKQIMEVNSVSEDYQAKHIIMSSAFVDQLHIETSIELMMHFTNQPFLSCNHETMQAFLSCYQMFERLLQQKDNPYILDTLRHLIHAYFLNFNYYYHKQLQVQAPKSREEELCMEFLSLLQIHYREQHLIDFYADKLSISTKHMSLCVKRITGFSAKQCINKYLITYAQQKLRSPKASISQVSHELGFVDVNTFGKFFKSQVGISPREYISQCQTSN